jgi:WD40 repeat protein
MNLQFIGTIREHVHRITSLAIAPDNQTLVSGSRDTTVKVWNAFTGELLHNLSAHTQAVLSVAIDSEGRILVTGGEDRTIKVWELQSGKLIYEIIGHDDYSRSPDSTVKGQAKCLAISPNNKLLACARQYGDEIQLFDLNNGELINSLPNGWEPYLIIFSPDGQILAGCFNDKVTLWHIPSLEVYGSCEFFCFESSAAISPNLRLAACSYYKGGGIELINTETGEQFHALSHIALSEDPGYSEHDSADTLCFSPDGHFLASSGSGVVQLWNTQTWKNVCSTNVFKTWSADDIVMAISPNSKLLAIGDRGGGIQVWQIDSDSTDVPQVIKPYARNSVPDTFNPAYVDWLNLQAWLNNL